MAEWCPEPLKAAARAVCRCTGHRGPRAALSTKTNCCDLEKKLSHFLSDFFPHRGHSPEWYSKGFGHLCAAEVARIRNSFQPLIAEGPETKIWVLPSVTSNSGKRKLKWRVWQRVCMWESERKRNWRTWLMPKNGNVKKLECWRCKNFQELS